MKLTFIKHIYGDKMVIVPRAELTAEEAAEKGNVAVSLSRTGGDKCVFTLLTLANHDDHAPPWYATGDASEGSTDPTMKADDYMKRIVADIEKGAGPITVVYEEVVHDMAAEFAAAMQKAAKHLTGKAPGQPETPEGWKHHGVEEEEEDPEGEVH